MGIMNARGNAVNKFSKKYVHTERRAGRLKTPLLPGETCARCKRKRAQTFAELSPMGVCLEDKFESIGGGFGINA